MSATAEAPSIVVLGLVVGVAPIATDAYLGALPALEHDLRVSGAIAQSTLTAFLVGFAAGQLLGGPLSDRRGRRVVLLVGLGLFVLMGIGAAVAPTAWVLIAGRALQGVGGGAAGAAARAAVADAWTGRVRAERIAALSAILLAAPIVAPVAGGLLLSVSGWRIVMALPSLVGAVAVMAVLFRVPETRRIGSVTEHGSLLSVLRRGPLRRQLVVSAIAAAANFAYVAASPFVLRDGFDLGPAAYGVVFAGNAAAMIAGSIAAKYLVRRIALGHIQMLGLAVATVAAAVLLLVAMLTQPPLWAAWALIAVTLLASGTGSVATSVLVQDTAEGVSGAASGMQGALVFIVGAAIAPLSGLAGGPDLRSSELVVLACLLTASALAIRPRSTDAAPRASASSTRLDPLVKELQQ